MEFDRKINNSTSKTCKRNCDNYRKLLNIHLVCFVSFCGVSELSKAVLSGFTLTDITYLHVKSESQLEKVA